MNRAKFTGYGLLLLLLISCGKREIDVAEEPDIRNEVIGAYNITCVRLHTDSAQQSTFTINYTDELIVERIDTSDVELSVRGSILKPAGSSTAYYSFMEEEETPGGNITELRFFPPDSVSFTDSGTGGNNLITWTCAGKKK